MDYFANGNEMAGHLAGVAEKAIRKELNRLSSKDGTDLSYFDFDFTLTWIVLSIDGLKPLRKYYLSSESIENNT